MDVNPTNNQSKVGIVLLCVCCLSIGWLLGFAWTNRTSIGSLWLQASEQKYLTMTGEVGPVTYLVQHTNYNDFELSSLALDDVLGVEVYELPNKAAIAFSRADSSSIDKVRNLPYVLTMQQQVIPMMCH